MSETGENVSCILLGCPALNGAAVNFEPNCRKCLCWAGCLDCTGLSAERANTHVDHVLWSVLLAFHLSSFWSFFHFFLLFLFVGVCPDVFYTTVRLVTLTSRPYVQVNYKESLNCRVLSGTVAGCLYRAHVIQNHYHWRVGGPRRLACVNKCLRN